jgi:hypothetical protein
MSTSKNKRQFVNKTVGPSKLVFGDIGKPSKEYKVFSATVAVTKEFAEAFRKEWEPVAKAALAEFLADPANKKHIKEAKTWKLTLPVKAEIDKDSGEETGGWLFGAKLPESRKDPKDPTKTIPNSITVFDSKKNIVSGMGIGRGSEVNVGVSLSPYTMPASRQFGISARLSGIQVLNKVGFGSDPSSFFKEEEDGYEGEPAPAKDTSAPFVGDNDHGDEGNGDF